MKILRTGLIVVATALSIGCYAKTAEEYADDAIAKYNVAGFMEALAKSGIGQILPVTEWLYYSTKSGDIPAKDTTDAGAAVSKASDTVTDYINQAGDVAKNVGSAVYKAAVEAVSQGGSPSLYRVVYSKAYQMLWEKLSAETKTYLDKIQAGLLDAGLSFKDIYDALKGRLLLYPTLPISPQSNKATAT